MGEIRSSVIIVCFNSRKHLEYGLPSIMRSLGSFDEIIVVDNASQDDSVSWIKMSFPQILVVSSETNLGFGGGSNLGAHAARGEFLVFLNPDTIVDPEWLNYLIVTLQSDDRAGMVTSKILLMSDPKKINTCGNDLHLTGITLCRGMGRDASEFIRLEEVAAGSGAAFAMRRKFFFELGGFDDDFFLYLEDTDLSLRVRLAGLRILYVPGSIVYHAYQLRFDAQKVFFQERNRYLMFLKTLHWQTLLVMLPIFLFGEIVTWGFVLLYDRPRIGNKYHAYRWIYSHWKDIKHKREHAQLNRRVSDRILMDKTTPQLDFTQVEPEESGKFLYSFLNIISVVLSRLTLALMRW